MSTFIRKFFICGRCSKCENLADADVRERVEIRGTKNGDEFPDLVEQTQIAIKPSSVVAARLSQFRKQDEADAIFQFDRNRIRMFRNNLEPEPRTNDGRNDFYRHPRSSGTSSLPSKDMTRTYPNVQVHAHF